MGSPSPLLWKTGDGSGGGGVSEIDRNPLPHRLHSVSEEERGRKAQRREQEADRGTEDQLPQFTPQAASCPPRCAGPALRTD